MKFLAGQIVYPTSDPTIKIKIVSADYTWRLYVIEYIDVPDDKFWLMDYNPLTYDAKTLDRDCEIFLSNESNIPPEFKKECVCENYILFTKGCKCGAIKPYQLKWD